MEIVFGSGPAFGTPDMGMGMGMGVGVGVSVNVDGDMSLSYFRQSIAIFLVSNSAKCCNSSLEGMGNVWLALPAACCTAPMNCGCRSSLDNNAFPAWRMNKQTS
jgi:hypothetical protein